MAKGGVARQPIIVYAPRGHGKTVLLDIAPSGSLRACCARRRPRRPFGSPWQLRVSGWNPMP